MPQPWYKIYIRIQIRIAQRTKIAVNYFRECLMYFRLTLKTAKSWMVFDMNAWGNLGRLLTGSIFWISLKHLEYTCRASLIKIYFSICNLKHHQTQLIYKWWPVYFKLYLKYSLISSRLKIWLHRLAPSCKTTVKI